MSITKSLKNLGIKTTYVSLEVLNLLTRSPFQPRENDDIGRMSLMQEIAERGLDQCIIVAITPEGSCIGQGHRRKSAFNLGFDLLPELFASLFPEGIPVKVIEFRSLSCDELRDLTLDQGSTMGLNDVFELYKAFKSLRAREETYGSIVYKLQSGFDHCFGRIPKTEAKIRSLEFGAEAAAKAGDSNAAEAGLNEARTAMGKYRNGAIQTMSAVAQLAAVHPDVEEYMRRVWTGELEKHEPVLSHGALLKLVKTMKDQPQDWEAAWKEATSPKDDSKVIRMAKKSELKSLIESAKSDLLLTILRVIMTGQIDVLKAIDADLIASKTNPKLPTAVTVAKAKG